MKLIERKPAVFHPEGYFEPLTQEIYTSFDYLASLQEEWDQLAVDTGAGIYFSYDWCRTWWQHYGRNRALQILLFRAGNRLEGLVPLFIDQIRLGPVKLRVAKLIGSEYTLTLCTPPILPTYAGPILESVIDHTTRHLHCDALSFGPLTKISDCAEELHRVCRRRPGLAGVVRDTVFAPQTQFNLPETFDGYLAALDKRQRTNYRRDLHQLNRDFHIKVDVIKDPARTEAEFTAFQSMHDHQWQVQGKLGHFGDWPGARAFNRDLIKTLVRKGRLRMVRLLANDQVVSRQLCYRFGDCLYWRLPARVSGKEWDRYGLGRIGLISMIELAIGEGIRSIEAGIGHYDYKVKLGGVELPVRSVLVAAGRKSSRLKARLFCRLADVLHFLYYRIWFNRIAPRLPFARRPLWKIWIRSRI